MARLAIRFILPTCTCWHFSLLLLWSPSNSSSFFPLPHYQFTISSPQFLCAHRIASLPLPFILGANATDLQRRMTVGRWANVPTGDVPPFLLPPLPPSFPFPFPHYFTRPSLSLSLNVFHLWESCDRSTGSYPHLSRRFSLISSPLLLFRLG